MSKLFEIQLETTFKNTEIPDEQPNVIFETSKKLPCIIDNQGEPVDSLL